MALMKPGVYIKEVDLSSRLLPFNPILKRIKEGKFNIWNWWEQKRKVADLLLLNLEDKEYLDFDFEIWYQPIKPVERIDLKLVIDKSDMDKNFKLADDAILPWKKLKKEK